MIKSIQENLENNLINLKKFKNQNKLKIKDIIWYCINNLFFYSLIPSSKLRVIILRIFGAQIGDGVIIKPYVKIKNPSKLEIGNYSWIGEGVWIDNISKISIGDNTCISQGVYLCSGSHNFYKEEFDLIEKPILIGSNCWIAAKNSIPPGTIIKDNSFIKFNSFYKN